MTALSDRIYYDEALKLWVLELHDELGNPNVMADRREDIEAFLCWLATPKHAGALPAAAGSGTDKRRNR